MQSILNRLSNIEKKNLPMVQSTTENVTEQSSLNTTTSHQLSREEQRASLVENKTTDHVTWGDHDDNKLPDYTEHIFWEPEPESDTLKLSPTTAKIVEDAFRHSISNEKRRGLKRKASPRDPIHKVSEAQPSHTV